MIFFNFEFYFLTSNFFFKFYFLHLLWNLQAEVYCKMEYLSTVLDHNLEAPYWHLHLAKISYSVTKKEGSETSNQ